MLLPEQTEQVLTAFRKAHFSKNLDDAQSAAEMFLRYARTPSEHEEL